MLEIIVVVALGVLLLVVYPSYMSVVERSKDSGTHTALVSYGREAAALSMLSEDNKLDPSAFKDAAGDMTTLGYTRGGDHAAKLKAVEYNEDYPTSTGAHRDQDEARVSYAINGDGTKAGLAVISPSGHCISITLDQSGHAKTVKPTRCDGHSALDQ